MNQQNNIEQKMTKNEQKRAFFDHKWYVFSDKPGFSLLFLHGRIFGINCQKSSVSKLVTLQPLTRPERALSVWAGFKLYAPNFPDIHQHSNPVKTVILHQFWNEKVLSHHKTHN